MQPVFFVRSSQTKIAKVTDLLLIIATIDKYYLDAICAYTCTLKQICFV